MTPIKPAVDPYAGVTQSIAEAPPTSEADAPPVSHEEFEAVQRDLDQALAKADEHWKLYLGAHAEMENLRKRAERDVQNAHKFALERFFGELLPARDSLELGLAATSDAVDIARLREGVELTLKQLAAAMEKFGARELNPLGARFNPNEHEAMAMLPTDQAEPNTVVQVLQKGYLLNERLLRPAKVIVAQALPKPAS
ncbi:MAG TPA: nucleotide exchange factor GrpE [Candidatus Contendobacter sp.]|nr:nucleotide exchange factor GrpE [Candidatus Contendobacter sp.]HRD48484.1 nucleotide exchange factor GrpE [Candidatus Contendobacter sp.]